MAKNSNNPNVKQDKTNSTNSTNSTKGVENMDENMEVKNLYKATFKGNKSGIQFDQEFAFCDEDIFIREVWRSVYRFGEFTSCLVEHVSSNNEELHDKKALITSDNSGFVITFEGETQRVEKAKMLVSSLEKILKDLKAKNNPDSEKIKILSEHLKNAPRTTSDSGKIYTDTIFADLSFFAAWVKSLELLNPSLKKVKSEKKQRATLKLMAQLLEDITSLAKLISNQAISALENGKIAEGIALNKLVAGLNADTIHNQEYKPFIDLLVDEVESDEVESDEIKA